MVVSSHADTLDWNSVNWSNEDLTESFNVGGTTISFVISGDTGGIENNSPNDTTQINGSSSTEQTLFLNTNHGNRNDDITITITFSQPVTNISFTIYDIDADSSSYVDQIRNVYGSDGVNTYAFSATGSSGNSVASSGTTSLTVTGTSSINDDSDNGNATFSYTGAAVTTISFTYGNNTDTSLGDRPPGNPGNQWIGLGDITYTVVPEPAVSMGAALLLGLALWKSRQRLCSIRLPRFGKQ